jgi:hypothetical protein
MSRALGSLLVLCFAALLLLPGIAALVGVEGGGEALQNRTVKARPTPTWATVWAGTFSGDVTDWLWDVLPLRDRLLALDHRLDLHVLGDSPVPDKVVFGDDGFAFRIDRVAGHRAGAIDAERVLTVVKHLQTAATETGRRLLVVVSPTKASLYPELLPAPHRRLFEQSAAPTMTALRERGPPVLDLWTPLLAEKARLAASTSLPHPRLRFLFRPLDDHWSLETGQLQARHIVEAIAPGAWHEDRIVVDAHGHVEKESELSSIYLKTGDVEPYTTARLADGVTLRRRQVPIPGGYAAAVFDNTSEGERGPDPARVLVVRDSFLSPLPDGPEWARDGGIDAIAASFAHTTFIHWGSIGVADEHDDIVRPLFRDHDVVVLQVAQGELGTFVARAGTVIRLMRDRPPKPKTTAPTPTTKTTKKATKPPTKAKAPDAQVDPRLEIRRR